MSHHTQEQVRAAFAAAPFLLEELKRAGLTHPRVTLHADASGRVTLGTEGEVTQEQFKVAVDLVRSNRVSHCPVCWSVKEADRTPAHQCEVSIDSCCGFVSYAERRVASDPEAA